MNETKMAAFKLLQCLFKTLLILYPLKVIWNPISQGRKSTFFSRVIRVKIHKTSKGGLHPELLRIEVPG
jgi:hypothetical protein